MGFFDSAAVLPMWQLIMIIGFFMITIFVMFLILILVLGIPEVRVLTKASLFKRYVLFEHSSYSTAKLSTVKIGEIALEPTKNKTKIRPRHKDDVERVGKIEFIHTHDLSPYPASSTTAFIVDKFISELRTQGLNDTDSIIDALLRCKLDESQMIGYIEEFVIKELPVLDENGEQMFTVFESNGDVLKTPLTEQKEIKVKYQTQITAEELETLRKLKKKLSRSWFGVDSSGSEIFSYSHLSKVVDIGMSATPSDLEDLQHVAERHGRMGTKGESKNLMLYGIVVVLVGIGAGVFLKIAGFV